MKCASDPHGFCRGINFIIMTQEIFLEKLKNNEHFINGFFKVISEYKCDKCKVLVETPYGICSCDPYNYEILKEFIFDNSKEASMYEEELLRINKNFSYKPYTIFNGNNECFYDYTLSGLI